MAQVIHVDVPQVEKQRAVTQREFAEHEVARDNSDVLENGYEKFGWRDEQWDDEAIEFIKLTNLSRNRHPSAPTVAELRAAAERVIDTGCDDPLVLYFIGRAFDEAEREELSYDYLKKACDGLPSSGYPSIIRAVAAARLARWLEGSTAKDKAAAPYRMALDALVQAAVETPDDPFARRAITLEMAYQADRGLPTNLAGELAERLMNTPAVDRCTANTVMGVYHRRLAWLKRGNGFANTVTDEGWAGFAEHMQIAREHLETAYRIDPNRPEAATSMIAVTMTGHADPEDLELDWFDRAVAAQFDWEPAYHTVLWALRPRWGGSHEAMFAFGRGCFNNQRFDTVVPTFYIVSLLDIVEDSGGSAEFLREKEVYEAVQTIVDRTLEQPHHAHLSKSLRSKQIAIAWSVGEFAEARRVLDLLDQQGESIDRESIAGFRLRPRDLEEAVIVSACAASSAVKDGDRLLSAEDPASAMTEFEQALAASPTNDARLQAVLRGRIVTATTYRDFLAGDWVPLKFERGLPGWRELGGVWYAPNENTIKAGFDGEAEVFLVNAAPVGQRFEITGTMDVTAVKFHSPGNAGLVFGFNQAYGDVDWLAVRILRDRADRQACIGYRFKRDEMAVTAPLTSGKQKFDFHIQMWDRELVCSIDKAEVFAGVVRVEPDQSLGTLFGFGGYANRPNGYAAFENLKIRRLTERPASLSAGAGRP